LSVYFNEKLKIRLIYSNLANKFKKCYSKGELFLFGVKDNISKTFRLDDH